MLFCARSLALRRALGLAKGFFFCLVMGGFLYFLAFIIFIAIGTRALPQGTHVFGVSHTFNKMIILIPREPAIWA